MELPALETFPDLGEDSTTTCPGTGPFRWPVGPDSGFNDVLLLHNAHRVDVVDANQVGHDVARLGRASTSRPLLLLPPQFMQFINNSVSSSIKSISRLNPFRVRMPKPFKSPQLDPSFSKRLPSIRIGRDLPRMNSYCWAEESHQQIWGIYPTSPSLIELQKPSDELARWIGFHSPQSLDNRLRASKLAERMKSIPNLIRLRNRRNNQTD